MLYLVDRTVAKRSVLTGRTLISRWSVRYLEAALHRLQFRLRDFVTILGFVTLLTTALAFPHVARAQVLPALEMDSSGASTSPIATGITSLAVTMVNNANNPNDNAFSTVAPPVTATFELFNQQYTGLPVPTVGGVGVAFGGDLNPAISPYGSENGNAKVIHGSGGIISLRAE